ncbi:MAG TPA: hypothetical protein VGF16_04960 [Bryobacteraceae bacterium]|jgi:hypothetical protein
MTRRGLLLTGLACALRADDADQIWEVFTGMAAALSESKPEEFMQAFNSAMPGYDDLRRNVTALLLAYDAHSSIELVDETGDGAVRTLQLDWFLQLVEKQDTAARLTRRREPVRCQLVKNKKWRISSFEPLTLFAPPAP